MKLVFQIDYLEFTLKIPFQIDNYNDKTEITNKRHMNTIQI